VPIAAVALDLPMPDAPDFLLLDAWPDAVLRLDAGGRTLFASAAARALGGHTSEDLAARLPDHIATLRKFCCADASLPEGPLVWTWQLPDGGQLRVEHRFRRLVGGTLLVIARPLDDPDGRNPLTRSSGPLGVLAGGLAHNFNNLLTGILGYVELLRRLQPTGAGRGYLDHVEDLADRAADLCQQMLAYAGKGRFFLEPVGLNNVLEMMQPLIEAAIPGSTHLFLQLQPDLPPVEADVNQVRQLVFHLVRNASEALDGEEGTVVLRTWVDSLPLSEPGWVGTPTARGKFVFFEVADPGRGMPPEVLARIFDPFFTTKFPGRGLSLSAVLGIVTGHRGALKVESTPGKGTTFTVALPALPAPPTVAPEPSPITGTATVLVVDDEGTIRQLIQRILMAAGYRTLPAASGQEGLDQLAAAAVDLVLLDLTMPGMSGAETLAQIRKRWPGLRVVLMSGYTEGVETSSHVSFLAKPFRPIQLLECVQQALAKGP
jgi:signal transduction histidine kinase/CheY-like chemotaxis protein